MFDPKVKLKQEFLTRWKQSGKTKIDGNEWYQIQALRAVNQAIGHGSPNYSVMTSLSTAKIATCDT